MSPYQNILDLMFSFSKIATENDTMRLLIKKLLRAQAVPFSLKEELVKAGERHNVDPTRYIVTDIVVDNKTGEVFFELRDLITHDSAYGKARCNFDDGDAFSPCRGLTIALHNAVQNLPKGKKS